MIDIKQGEIWHRDDFPLLATWRRLTRCVEVGVELAEYSRVFVNRHWNLDLYVGVDNYTSYGEMRIERESDYLIALQRYAAFGPKAKLIRANSVDVATSVSLSLGHDGLFSVPFDFVYIDASHDKASVLADIQAWWPLLSDRGIIAGHDWELTTGEHKGVQEAVREFAESVQQDIYITYKDDPQSWYIYKSGMPGADWIRQHDLDSEDTPV